MKKLSPLALANAMGLFVFLLHPFFHIWVAVSPSTYIVMVRLFAPGVTPVITPFDYDISVTIIATVLKAAVFWGIGYCVGYLYNITRESK